MTANVDAMVREGIRAYRAGKKAEARTLLEKAAELDAYNEQAWMWLSAVVDTPEEQRICLENVLTINPNNQNAKQGLQMLTGGTPSPTSTTEPPKSASPFTTENISNSVEWEQPPTATSSPSSSFRPNEPSSQEYDSWVAGLGLGSGTSGDESSNAPSSALNNVEDIFGAGFFDDDDDEDEMDDFQSSVRKPAAMPVDDILADSSFDDGPFSAAALDLDDDLELPEPTSKPTSKMSRVDTKTLTSPVEKPSGGGILMDDDFDTELNYEDDPAEFFQRIPKNIPPTRLPGTTERPNPVLLLTLVMLMLLNMGAVAMLIGKLAG